MKRYTYIQKVLSLVTISFFLFGSTGITVISHHCNSCDDHSVKAGIFIPATQPGDACCSAAGTDCHSAPETKAPESLECCHFTIDRLKFDTFSVSYSKILNDIPVVGFHHKIPAPVLYSDIEIQSANLLHHNKHGGRSISILHCQILS